MRAICSAHRTKEPGTLADYRRSGAISRQYLLKPKCPLIHPSISAVEQVASNRRSAPALPSGPADQSPLQVRAPSSARVYVRAGLGQVLDYSRYVAHGRRALLLPDEPRPDLVSLLHSYQVGVVWESGETFVRIDPS